MKLITHTQITLDGVVQGNGGASEEERANGFTRGGWALGAGDEQTLKFIVGAYERADAFLFGRRTYEMFASHWGTMGPGSHPIADSLNGKPKYVASTTLSEASWDQTTVLDGDLANAVAELKARRDGELQVHGSGTLIRSLLQAGLVDELQLLMVPVVLGQGMRLFPQDGPDLALELTSTQTDSKGVTIQIYRPKGKPQYPG